MLDYIQNHDRKKKPKKQSEGQVPFDFLLPHSTWQTPTGFTDFSSAKEIAVDTETYDPRLKPRGPGFLRRSAGATDGHLCGVSLSDGTRSVYYPLHHAMGKCMDHERLAGHLRDLLGRTDQTIVFANASYDLGWLRAGLGVEVRGTIHDIQIADTLIDEERQDGYSLNALCKRWLGETKEETLLNAAANALGIPEAKAEMHKIPACYVGPYAERDADQTWRIWQKLKPELSKQNLGRVYSVEQRLVRTLFEMAWRGIRVDLNYAQELNHRWKKEEEALYSEIGFRDIWDADACATYLRRNGLTVGKSVTKGILESLAHPAAANIRRVREFNRCRETFLEQNLITNTTGGRIHPQYVQMHSDEGGTRTGRLSCKNPNAQQFPKRSTTIDAKAIRHCLIPEEGCLWAKFDYWSQEPVIQCHYGLVEGLGGAADVAAQFAENKKLYSFIELATGGRCNYDQAKAVVLGRSYGMGVAKMASSLNMDKETCEKVLRAFDQVVPYIGVLADRFSAVAKSRGYVRTLLGRRRHFDLWQPARKSDEYTEPTTLEQAKAQWAGRSLERAFTYKAFNAGVQGSAADQTKTGIVMTHEAVLLPQMTVHDEVSASVETEKQALQIKEILENCIQLRLPARADMDLGTSWC